MTSDIATRVAKGVALLDERRPGWVGQMNLAKLNVASVDTCVLGQVYGNFFKGEEWLDLNDEKSSDHGFDTYSRRYVEAVVEFRALNAEWRRVIKILRQKQVVEVKVPEMVAV